MLLTHEQYLEKWLRKPDNIDGGYGYQCIDAVKRYALEVFGIKLGAFGGAARAGWQNKKKTFDPKIWQKIPNTPTGVPKRGDIIFYDSPVETGHVAIVHEATVDDVLLVEQNGQTGTGDGKGFNTVMFENRRDYKHCLGWYHKI